MKHLILYEEWCSAGKLDTGSYQIDEGDLSDILHFVGDVAAAVSDTVVPGSGAVLDVINMLSYWVQAHLSTDGLEKTKYVLSGIIQAFAIFDPINALSTVLKAGLNKVITAIATKSPATIAAARIAARQVADGLTLLLGSLTGFVGRMITKLSDSKFGSAIAWLSKKLGITNVLAWLKTFITQTAPTYIKQFLTRIRDTFNPSQAGAGSGSAEFNQLLTRNITRLVATNYAAGSVHTTAMAFAQDWNKGSQNFKGDLYANPNIVAQDNTRVVQNYRIPGFK